MSSESKGTGVAALLAVTLVWAFSFGLIGRFLSGIDSFWVAFVRLLLAALCFLPFLRLKGLTPGNCLVLAAAGGVQFGVMYVSYLAAYQFLEDWQVALFSVLTPIWVALADSAFARRWAGRIFLAALLSVGGASVIRFGNVPSGNFWFGFLLMQTANLAFGFGQVWFREWKFRHPAIPERNVFGLLYGGAALLAALAALFSGSLLSWPDLEPVQWGVLLYLGLIASGFGFFFWNYGASRVSAGFLAASNNLVVPMGVVIAIGMNDRTPDWLSLLTGSGLIVAALVVGRKKGTRNPSQSIDRA